MPPHRRTEPATVPASTPVQSPAPSPAVPSAPAPAPAATRVPAPGLLAVHPDDMEARQVLTEAGVTASPQEPLGGPAEEPELVVEVDQATASVVRVAPAASPAPPSGVVVERARQLVPASLTMVSVMALETAGALPGAPLLAEASPDAAPVLLADCVEPVTPSTVRVTRELHQAVLLPGGVPTFRLVFPEGMVLPAEVVARIDEALKDAPRA